MKFFRQAEESGLEKLGDKALEQFIFEFCATDVKLARALNGIARGQDNCDPAYTIAYSMRALDHLHKS